MRLAVVSFALLVGCGGRVVEERGSTADSGSFSEVAIADDASIDDEPPPALDAKPPPELDAEPPPGPPSLAECFGEMGKSNPSTLKDLMYDFATCGDPGAPPRDCVFDLRFNVGCAIELGPFPIGSGPVRSATTSEADCLLLTKWATSERLLGALTDGSKEMVACRAQTPIHYEATDVGGTGLRQKTFFCDVEPFVTHRKCMALVRAKYFPEK